ncbi:Fc.00g073440.m01.CDS01 [Cosmosporella sp. VM-42]
MKVFLSATVAVALAAVWGSAASTSPPPYPTTRTLVSLHPARVCPLPDPDYDIWRVKNRASSKFKANGLHFTLAATTKGTKLHGGANKPVYKKPLPSVGQRLIGAGISTDTDGGSITLTITGLPAGRHSISTWHNAWEDLDKIPTVAVIIDGVSKISGRPQSARENNMFDSAASFAFFDSSGETVKVVYKPTGGNIYLNGFEIDSESVGRQIRFPHPEHRDKHVQAKAGAVTASWLPTFDVDGGTYNVYFGKSPDKLKNLAMELFEPEITFSGLTSGTTYYWRVDVYTSEFDDVHLGRIWKFRVV